MGDLKPGNILLSKPVHEGGIVKLADFGLACSRKEEDLKSPSLRQCVQSGKFEVGGTNSYLAPEVAYRKVNKPIGTWTEIDQDIITNEKSDMWALGVILHN